MYIIYIYIYYICLFTYIYTASGTIPQKEDSLAFLLVSGMFATSAATHASQEHHLDIEVVLPKTV